MFFGFKFKLNQKKYKTVKFKTVQVRYVV